MDGRPGGEAEVFLKRLGDSLAYRCLENHSSAVLKPVTTEQDSTSSPLPIPTLM